MRSGTRRTVSFLAVFLMVWLTVRYLLPLCFPFLLGTGLALLAEPLVRLLCRRLRLPRGMAAGLGVGVVFLVVALLLLMACAFLLRELGVLASILPDLTDTARSGLALLRGWTMDLAGHAPRSVRGLLQQNVADFFSGGTALLDRFFRYVPVPCKAECGDGNSQGSGL